MGVAGRRVRGPVRGAGHFRAPARRLVDGSERTSPSRSDHGGRPDDDWSSSPLPRWPGHDPRQALTLAARWQNVLAKREWFLFFPAAGLGLYSGALAFLWALPTASLSSSSVPWRVPFCVPRLLAAIGPPRLESRALVRATLAVGILVILVNLPLIVTEVGYSARTFTPTWLVLSCAVAAGAASISGGGCGSSASWPVPLRPFATPVACAERLGAGSNRRLQSGGGAVDRRPDPGRSDRSYLRRRTHRRESSPARCLSLARVPFDAWSSWIEYHTGRVVEDSPERGALLGRAMSRPTRR